MSTLLADTIRKTGGTAGVDIRVKNTSVYESDGGTSVTQNLVQGLCKAWMQLDMGDNAIDDSHNVSSITDYAQGKFNTTFTNAYASVNHSDVAMTGANAFHVGYGGDVGKSASTTGVIAIINTSNAAIDGSPYNTLITIGDLA